MKVITNKFDLSIVHVIISEMKLKIHFRNTVALQVIRLAKLPGGILKAIVPIKIQPIKSNLSF